MPAAYQWSHISTGVEVLRNDSKLYFTPLRLSDGGNYTCTIWDVMNDITMENITYSNTKCIIIQGEKFEQSVSFH